MNEVNCSESGEAKRSVLDRLVMWMDKRNKKNAAKSLCKKLWEANDILLYARHASFNKTKYSKYFELLEMCSDEIERAIIIVKKDT
jgi:hypothetical protein